MYTTAAAASITSSGHGQSVPRRQRRTAQAATPSPAEGRHVHRAELGEQRARFRPSDCHRRSSSLVSLPNWLTTISTADAGHVADQDRLGQQVRDQEPEPGHPADQADHPDREGDQRGQLGPTMGMPTCADQDRDRGRGHQRGGRFRTDRQLPRGAEHGVDEHRCQHRPQAGHRGQSHDFGVGHHLRHQVGRHGDARRSGHRAARSGRRPQGRRARAPTVATREQPRQSWPHANAGGAHLAVMEATHAPGSPKAARHWSAVIGYEDTPPSAVVTVTDCTSPPA